MLLASAAFPETGDKYLLALEGVGPARVLIISAPEWETHLQPHSHSLHLPNIRKMPRNANETHTPYTHVHNSDSVF